MGKNSGNSDMPCCSRGHKSRCEDSIWYLSAARSSWPCKGCRKSSQANASTPPVMPGPPPVPSTQRERLHRRTGCTQDGVSSPAVSNGARFFMIDNNQANATRRQDWRRSARVRRGCPRNVRPTAFRGDSPRGRAMVGERTLTAVVALRPVLSVNLHSVTGSCSTNS